MSTSEKTKKKLMGKRYDKQFTEVKTHMPVNIKKNGYLTSHQENTNYKHQRDTCNKYKTGKN